MLKSIDKAGNAMTNSNNTEIFDRLSSASVELLKRLNPKLTENDEVKAGDIVLVLGRQSKEIASLFKKLDITSKAKNMVKVPDWLVNSYHEAYLSNSEYVEIQHLALSLLLDINVEKYYIAKKKLTSKSTLKADFSNRYFEDITEIVSDKSIEKEIFIGRERELTNLIVNLSSSKTKPVLLLGDSGSGKTAIMYELARRINEQRVPANLLNSRILRIKFSAIISAIPIESGQFPNAFLSQLLSHIAATDKEAYEKTILFFDDLHFGMSFFIGVETISPENDILLVGAANDDMQEKFWDSPISKMWEVVEFEDQTDADLRSILTQYAKLKSKSENGSITYTEDAIKKIVEMNKNNTAKEVLPGSGIKTIDALAVYKRHISADYDLMKTLTSDIKHTKSKVKIKQMYRNLKQVSAAPIVIDQADVETFFITTSGGKDDTKGLELSNTQLLALEDELGKSIIGQEDSVKALARALRVSSLKLSGGSRPIGSFLFLGPTGVGKTETAKVLAKSLFGLRDGSKTQPANFIRIDMSEFTEKHTVSKLFGAPPGYVGYDDSGSLADFVQENPSSVVLFDEIDKAHPEVLTSLLHIMDEGEMRSNTGEIVSLENVIILMTSNHGAELITKEDIGFSYVDGAAAKKQKIIKTKAEWHQKLRDYIKTVLKPEFLNRFDEIIIYDQLDEDAMLKILDLMIEPMTLNLRKRNIKFGITKSARKWLVKKCNAKEYGARELRRILNKEVTDAISQILFKDEKIKKIHVTTEGEGLSIEGN
jgi:ATP-dependent Clp protease ATP-binding subunit ClpC